MSRAWAPRRYTPPKKRVVPPMRRGTALDIAERSFRDGKQLSPALRDEILATQMVNPAAKNEPIFAGWTTDEKIAFHERGIVPARYFSTSNTQPNGRAAVTRALAPRSERAHAGTGRAAAPQGHVPDAEPKGLLADHGRRASPPVRETR